MCMYYNTTLYHSLVCGQDALGRAQHKLIKLELQPLERVARLPPSPTITGGGGWGLALLLLLLLLLVAEVGHPVVGYILHTLSAGTRHKVILQRISIIIRTYMYTRTCTSTCKWKDYSHYINVTALDGSHDGHMTR